MNDQEFYFNLPAAGPDPAVEALEARRLLSLTAPVDADPAPNNVPPSAAEGTAVGLTAASAGASGAPISYALTDDAGGRFTIDRATGIVTVALAAMLAAPAAHTITVQAADGAGGSAARSFVVGVGNAPVAPATTDRARVNVAGTADGLLTVRSDQGTPLRGGTAFVYESGRRTGKTAYISDPAYYREMRANGLNALRLIAFDPYMRSRGHNHTDLDDPQEVAALLSDFDTVVDLASKEGMYVIINYHDVGGYEKEYLTKFWDLVAPRYRDRTHVAYELMNEPVKWFPRDYKDEHLRDVKALYDRVRDLAPQTHQVLLTFANTASYDQVSMRLVAERLSAIGDGVDWDNASVGFHPYQTAKSSNPIVDLVRQFPAINTEQNLPDNEGCVAMDGEQFGVQTMERLGLSWCHWMVHGPENFAANYVGRVLPDAGDKAYLWEFDAEDEEEDPVTAAGADPDPSQP